MGKLLDSFLEYLKNTPKEQVEKDWAPSGEWDDVGPTLSEFLELYKECTDISYYSQNINNQTNINFEKSELCFGFFLYL